MKKKIIKVIFVRYRTLFGGFWQWRALVVALYSEDCRVFGRDWLPPSLWMVDRISPVLHVLPKAFAHGSSSSSAFHSAPRCFFCCHRAAVHYLTSQPAEFLLLPTSSFTMVVTLYTFSRYPPHIPLFIHETENEYSQNPVKRKFLTYSSAK
jgi:hypothetical protein